MMVDSSLSLRECRCQGFQASKEASNFLVFLRIPLQLGYSNTSLQMLDVGYFLAAGRATRQVRVTYEQTADLRDFVGRVNWPTRSSLAFRDIASKISSCIIRPNSRKIQRNAPNIRISKVCPKSET
jgi:hypothetical protein